MSSNQISNDLLLSYLQDLKTVFYNLYYLNRLMNFCFLSGQTNTNSQCCFSNINFPYQSSESIKYASHQRIQKQMVGDQNIWKEQWEDPKQRAKVKLRKKNICKSSEKDKVSLSKTLNRQRNVRTFSADQGNKGKIHISNATNRQNSLNQISNFNMTQIANKTSLNKKRVPLTIEILQPQFDDQGRQNRKNHINFTPQVEKKHQVMMESLANNILKQNSNKKQQIISQNQNFNNDYKPKSTFPNNNEVRFINSNQNVHFSFMNQNKPYIPIVSSNYNHQNNLQQSLGFSNFPPYENQKQLNTSQAFRNSSYCSRSSSAPSQTQKSQVFFSASQSPIIQPQIQFMQKSQKQSQIQRYSSSFSSDSSVGIRKQKMFNSMINKKPEIQPLARSCHVNSQGIYPPNSLFNSSQYNLINKRVEQSIIIMDYFNPPPSQNPRFRIQRDFQMKNMH